MTQPDCERSEECHCEAKPKQPPEIASSASGRLAMTLLSTYTPQLAKVLQLSNILRNKLSIQIIPKIFTLSNFLNLS